MRGAGGSERGRAVVGLAGVVGAGVVVLTLGAVASSTVFDDVGLPTFSRDIWRCSVDGLEDGELLVVAPSAALSVDDDTPCTGQPLGSEDVETDAEVMCVLGRQDVDVHRAEVRAVELTYERGIWPWAGGHVCRFEQADGRTVRSFDVVGVSELAEADGRPHGLELPAPGDVSGQFLADGTPVWVVHEEAGEVHVLEAQTDERAWAAAWCPTAGWFESYWGATFAPDGRRIGGPAATGLAAYEVVDVSGGGVTLADEPPAATDGRAEPPSPAAWGCWYDTEWEEGAVFHPAWGPLRDR